MNYFNWHDENSKVCKWPTGTLTCTCRQISEGKEMPLDLDNLKEEVSKILVMNHDFLLDEAEAAISKSVAESPDAWSENADAKDLANYLAEDDDDE